MTGIYYGIIALLIFLLALLLFRTALFTRAPMETPPPEEIDVDGGLAARHLGLAIQCETVSQGVGDLIDSGSYKTVQAFLNLHKNLQVFYPKVYKTLKLEVVHDFSLLFCWTGSDETLKPMLLMAHQDVVPIEENTSQEWQHPPFSGQIADGAVWGRGSLDFKNGLIGVLEAVEWLLNAGFQPSRTVYLAFGHDEEAGGMRGARGIVEILEERGIRFDSVLDEGGAVIQGVLPGVERPVGLIGIAEKGYLSVELSVSMEGGHSSTPEKETTIGILSTAIERIQNHPPKATLEHILKTLKPVAGELSFFSRVALANAWLFRPLLVRKFENAPKLCALMRTTMAPTILSAGVKDNVLPTQAKAVINCRIIPGSSIAETIQHMRKVIADPRVVVRPLRMEAPQPVFAGQMDDSVGLRPELNTQIDPDGKTDPEQAPINGWGPSAVSPLDSIQYGLMEFTVRQVFPDALVAPFLMMAASDSRHYTGLSDNVYRFIPVCLGNADLGGIHSTNEHLSVENCRKMVQFYVQWIKNNATPEPG
jgi:carboxypeptidase PM20D1